MFPAVAYDGSDCFDAISRALSYVYSRPWCLGFFTVIAAVYAAVCYLFVRLFAFLLLLVTHWFLNFSIFTDATSKQANKLQAVWPEPAFMNLAGSATVNNINWSESFAAFLTNLAVLVVIGLLIAFLISFYFSASTIIYALMRNKVDGTDLEDVYTYSEKAQFPEKQENSST